MCIQEHWWIKGRLSLVPEIQARLTEAAKARTGTQWIRAAKYNDTHLAEGRHPTRWELDEACPNNPVILVHDSGKCCVLNSLALQSVGITKDTPDPAAGQIGRDNRQKAGYF